LKINYDNDYQDCFVCGKNNSLGFKLNFDYDKDKDEVYTIFKPQKYMQGYENILHGGFTSMLLDEVMAKVCLKKDIHGVTAKIEIKFKKPIFVNESVEFRGKIVNIKGKKILLKASCSDLNGEKKAEANGLFIRV